MGMETEQLGGLSLREALYICCNNSMEEESYSQLNCKWTQKETPEVVPNLAEWENMFLNLHFVEAFINAFRVDVQGNLGKLFQNLSQ